ncbi:MAG: prepilin-type N-terminal cleavage/methylation domain-containing protein [Bacteriovoracaceae bacterium]|nr:prepilin-type N-terminal cleavage/methylation domain-containing protein [Bacteriovoracaceae bacterium]
MLKVVKVTMQILAQKTSKNLSNDQGFSLIEILVALLLAALIFLAVPSSENSRRHQDLQHAVDDIDRAVRFASNEAVLRNTIVRLKISLDKTPVEFKVEYGPRENMVLPVLDVNKSLNLEEQELEKKKLAKIDSQFTSVEEFAEITREFSVEVEFLGAATSFQKKLIRDQSASIYFYPTGERDGALFFFGTQDELASLEVQPFQDKTKAEFYPAPTTEGNVGKTEDFRETKMEEIAKNWLEK